MPCRECSQRRAVTASEIEHMRSVMQLRVLLDEFGDERRTRSQPGRRENRLLGAACLMVDRIAFVDRPDFAEPFLVHDLLRGSAVQAHAKAPADRPRVCIGRYARQTCESRDFLKPCLPARLTRLVAPLRKLHRYRSSLNHHSPHTGLVAREPERLRPSTDAGKVAVFDAHFSVNPFRAAPMARPLMRRPSARRASHASISPWRHRASRASAQGFRRAQVCIELCNAV